MDAFYASIEQLDNVQLRGIPLAVGSSSVRGVVVAASYEARKYGVKSALSSKIALQRCPHLTFVAPRFERYREISQKIRKIFYQYTDLVEPLSLDEAYLDVTKNHVNNPSATLLAMKIRREIFEKTGLTASAGISVNKFIAKIASDINKPNGQKTVVEEEIQQFLDPLDIRKFYGIGKVTASKMYELGIFTGADLRSKSLEFLEMYFKNSAQHFYDISRGIHHSPVNHQRMPKSIGAENTFESDIFNIGLLEKELDLILPNVIRRLQKHEMKGKTITLKIKYADFSLQTRSLTISDFTDQLDEIRQTLHILLHKEPLRQAVRLLGVSLSNFDINLVMPSIVQLEIEFPELHM